MSDPSTDGPRHKAFFISPIGDAGSPERAEADKVLKHIVRKALVPLGCEVERADEDSNPGLITPRVIAAIQSADLVVIDLSGLNPNVFYEMAVAHGFHRPVVHIQRTGERTPFDVKDMRTIRYDLGDLDDVDQAREKLAQSARTALSSPDEVGTPLRSAGKFLAVEQSTDPAVEAQAEVLSQLATVHRMVRQLGTDLRAVLKDRDVVPEDDMRSVLKWLESMTERGELTSGQLEDLITQTTSERWDVTVRKLIDQLPATEDPWDRPAAPSRTPDPWASSSRTVEEPPF
jgi:hypothetical protein